MRSTLIFALVVTTALGACGGRQSVSLDDAPPDANTLIPSNTRSGLFAQRRAALAAIDLTSPMDQVTGLVVEKVPGGIIVRATGLDLYSTTFGARLRPSNVDELPEEDGTLVYAFRRILPEGAQQGGPEATREITVGRFITDQSLRGVRVIRVDAARNSRTVRP